MKTTNLQNSVKQKIKADGINELTKNNVSPDKPLKRLNANIDAALFNEFKAAVSAKGLKINDVVIEMVEKYLGKRVEE